MKKIISVVLTLVLVLGLCTTAFAAGNLPTPVAAYGFEADEGFAITGGKLASDADRGNVLTLDGGAKGASRANLDSDLYGKTDWSDGLTISFWVKAANADPGISPLYSFNIVDHDAQGYIATTDSLEIAINTDGNSGAAEYPRVWADPAVVDATAQPVLKAGSWQHVAVTQSASGMTIYLDGKQYSQPALGPSSANFKLFLDQIKYVYGLQLGGWNCMWWDEIGAFAGSFDDVCVFNKALTADEVAAVKDANFADLTASGSGNTVLYIVIAAAVVVIACAAVLLLKKKKGAEKKN